MQPDGPEIWRQAMILYAIAAVIALAVLIYLIAAMLKPEAF